MNKLNILYIGHLFEGTAWSTAACDYILALDRIGVNVVPRSIKLGLPSVNPPERILELMERSSRGCDICIQHVLPHHFVYSGNFKKNIGMFPTESDNFIASGWQNYINMMDEIIVFCEDSVQACRNSGVTIPISVVPHCINLDKFDEKRNVIDGLPIGFKFYFIGEYSQRKNLPALIRAFHAEFHPEENVNLIIKTNSHELNRGQLLQELDNLTSKIKNDLRIYPHAGMYRPETFIVDRLSEDEMLDLHYSCDCLCIPSLAEGFFLPALTAMGMGKYIIGNNTGGIKDQLKTINGYSASLINNTLSPVTGVRDTFDGLMIGKENWCSIDICHLMKEMRRVYNNFKPDTFFYNDAVMRAKERVRDFSYSNIADKLLGVLES